MMPPPSGLDDPRASSSSSSRRSHDRSSSRDRHSSRRHRSRSPRSRSRDRDRDRSERSRSRERRRKKKSGWDQAPTPEMLAAAAAGGMMLPGMYPGMDPSQMMQQQQQAPQQPAVSGSIHPSRMSQLGNLPGAVPAQNGASGAYNPLSMMMPPHLAALMGSGGPSQATSSSIVVGASNISPANLPGTRQARRVYVGGLPMPLTEVELKDYVVGIMRQMFPDLPPGECVVSIYINVEKKFGFVEFRSPEEATTGMGLDGLNFRGSTLRIKRPSDYNPAVHGNAPSASRMAPQLAAFSSGAGSNGSSSSSSGGGGGGSSGVSSQVPDGPNKVFCGGLPYSLSEEEVKLLLASFGQLKAFHLVKDRETNSSKGYCFFEFVDPSVTDTAVMGLHGLKIGDKTLTVRRAQLKGDVQPGMGAGVGLGGAVPFESGLTPAQLGALAAVRAQGGFNALPPFLPQQQQQPPQMAPALPPSHHAPTRVLVLFEMVVPDMLRDNQEYREIFEDVESECQRYGRVISVIIPRPEPSGQHVSGLGKVFVEFEATEQAVKARAEIEGRQFDGRTVRADFWDEQQYAQRHLD